MPKQLLHEPGVTALGQQQGGAGVAQVVKPDAGQPGLVEQRWNERYRGREASSGVPRVLVKTRPWSCQASPGARRSSRWCTRVASQGEPGHRPGRWGVRLPLTDLGSLNSDW